MKGTPNCSAARFAAKALAFFMVSGLMFASAQPGAGNAATEMNPQVPGMSNSTPLGSGAFPAIMLVAPTLPTHTIYRPGNLSALNGQKLPVIAWGNGSCINAGNRFRWFLTEIASHGFLIAAIGPIGPGEIENRPAMPVLGATPGESPSQSPQVAAAMQQHVTHTQQLLDVYDWAMKENGRKGSPYYHHLAPSRFAVMGQSCGGEQAIEASADPRITTSIIWNAGLRPGVSTGPGGKPNLSVDDLELIHAPIAFISGDEKDIAYIHSTHNFELITKAPAFRAYRNNTTHGGTYGELNGGDFAKVGVAWLEWQLKSDETAAKTFIGADCGLCINPEWHVMKKNIP